MSRTTKLVVKYFCEDAAEDSAATDSLKEGGGNSYDDSIVAYTVPTVAVGSEEGNLISTLSLYYFEATQERTLGLDIAGALFILRLFPAVESNSDSTYKFSYEAYPHANSAKYDTQNNNK
ncbi:MAG: hypothetical protein KatS3mg083_138 [Candidatus Dojkabacteria bacterium]|nr:MAG: hypothetical protein KatS3mg083_138 [Candidatus Dojkabacteria bacterium]